MKIPKSESTGPQSFTILLSSITANEDYDQTSTVIQHSINQPCRESVKFDIKWVDKRVKNRVAASCKKAYWCNTPVTTLYIVWL